MNKFNSKTDLPTSQPNVLSLLDFCKGLAIAWVFLYHHKGGWFGWQGVHIFIVISGFGLTYSCLKKNEYPLWKQWYLRRFERLIPIYWLVCLSGFIIIVCIHLFEGKGLEFYLVRNLFVDFLLLRNFFHQSIYNDPNGPLWFVPFIISFYLGFPYLYTQLSKHKKTRNYLLILLGAAVVEFIYRAISLYLLDGCPIGTCDQFLQTSTRADLPLNKLPAIIPFQLQAPFGLFPSRIAEFMLGMLGAVFLVQNHQKFNNIFSVTVLILSIFTWLAGNALIYVGLWGWIFSDFIIALSLILWVVNLAWIFQQRFPFFFLKLSQIGRWSYYIFLTHYLFIYMFNETALKIIGEPILHSFSITKISMLGFTIIGTWIASWLLMQFDRTRFPELIIKKSIAKFLR